MIINPPANLTIIKSFMREHALIINIIAPIIVLSFQLLYVVNVHPVIGFDSGAIHNAMLDPNSPELRGYFSSNINNIFPLMLQYKLCSLFSNTSWEFCEILSIIFVDLSCVINYFTVLVIDKHKSPLIIYIQCLWLLFYPMAIVPYTDNWVLPFVSLMIYFLVCSFYSNYSVYFRAFTSFCGGVILAVTYFIKPSAIIPSIAFLLMLLFSFSHLKIHKVILMCLTLCFFGGALLSYSEIHDRIQQQSIIKVLPGREVPPIHFVQIGMTGEGGYDSHDALMMSVLQTRTARINYSKTKIKRELQKRGIGYLRFLIEKHGRNSADGTFAWLKEGHFINQKVNYHSNSTIKNFFVSFTLPEGRNLYNFKLLAQIIWILVIACLLFSYTDNHTIVYVFRLGIIGAFIYLLIFEGGRSRYLIQFLPMFLIMWSLTFNNSVSTIERIVQYFKGEKCS